VNECYIGGYWSGRAEPKESCIRRAHEYFTRLAAYDDAFAKWFKTGNTIKEALSYAIGTDPESLRKELKSEHYGPGDETQSLYAWNGELFGQGVVCDLYCGGAAPWTPSAALLQLPTRGPPFERLCSLKSLDALIRMTIEVWEPENAVASSDELRDSIFSEDEPGRPFIGWITYLSRRMAPSLPPLDGAEVEHFADGHLITLTKANPPGLDPELVETARRIDSHLQDLGILPRPQT
jgi:hypothetical protein